MFRYESVDAAPIRGYKPKRLCMSAMYSVYDNATGVNKVGIRSFTAWALRRDNKEMHL